jgi:hypothetical protein
LSSASLIPCNQVARAVNPWMPESVSSCCTQSSACLFCLVSGSTQTPPCSEIAPSFCSRRQVRTRAVEAPASWGK